MRTRPLPLLVLFSVCVAIGFGLHGCASDGRSPTALDASGWQGGGDSRILGRAAIIPPYEFEPTCGELEPLYDPWQEPHVPGEIVVRFGEPVDPVFDKSSSFESQYGVTLGPSAGPYQLATVIGGDAQAVAGRILDDPEVVSAEPNSIYYLGQEIILGFYEAGPPTGWIMDTTWTQRTDLSSALVLAEGVTVKVAVLDSEIFAPAGSSLASHLGARLDFVGHEAPGVFSGHPAEWHGTLIADLVHQVAPQAEILPVRVMDGAGAVRAFAVAQAVREAADLGARVMNMSFGGHVAPDFLESAFGYAEAHGALLVASGGNSGCYDDRHYPSSSTYVCGVGATDSFDRRAGFSSYGTTVEIAAPGVGLSGVGPDGQSAIGSGTSFAAPLVVGAAALRLEGHSGSDPNGLRSLLRSTSAALTSDALYLRGWFGGRIDFGRFLADQVFE